MSRKEFRLEGLSNFLIPGIILLLTVAFGFWLSRLGKPYNGALFTVHKLLALGAVIAAGILVVGRLKSVDSQALVVILWIITVLSVIALFASGALMSADKLDYSLMRTIHRVAPVVLLLAAVLAVYLMV